MATSVIKIADVTDGLSNTLMVGDKRLNLAYLGQIQGDDNEGYTAGWDHNAEALHQRAAARITTPPTAATANNASAPLTQGTFRPSTRTVPFTASVTPLI